MKYKFVQIVQFQDRLMCLDDEGNIHEGTYDRFGKGWEFQQVTR